jgi:hypothetical protein
MRLILAIVGLLFLLIGIGGAWSASARDTTVESSDGRSTHNIGLIGRQQADATFYGALAVVGAILFASAYIGEAARPDARLRELAEKAEEERGAMLRALLKLGGHAQAPVAHAASDGRPAVRTAPAKRSGDDAFEAAIAADVPRKGLR